VIVFKCNNSQLWEFQEDINALLMRENALKKRQGELQQELQQIIIGDFEDKK
jgi:hypothetical protein